MANRTRNIVLRVPVTAEERALIEKKMQQMGTRCFSVYARKMLIDGYVIKIAPFPVSRTRKSEKTLSEFLVIRMPAQAAVEAQRRASKRSGGIQPSAECGRTVL